MTVNRERVLMFVEALESGRFQQGTGQLHNSYSGGYCCLGVACVVAHEQGAVKLLPWTGEVFNPILPQAVADWFGFDSRDPVIMTGTREVTASTANDLMGLTFPEIAAKIRKYYLSDPVPADAQ